MKCIIGRKIEMTRVFDDQGNAIPVTVISVPQQIITQVKSSERDGVNAVQIGVTGGSKHMNKAQVGHVGDLGNTLTVMRDMRLDENQTLDRGDSWDCSIFAKGEKVTVTGTVKGRGFQGVVKRHDFRGAPKTHGHKDQLRMPGSISSRRQGPVAKGKRMGGHMGTNQVSIHNITVIQINPGNGLLYLKGAVPGYRGSLVIVKSTGDMVVKKFNDTSKAISFETFEKNEVEAVSTEQSV